MHLDTHVVAWLFAGLIDHLPLAAKRRLDAEPLAVSPIVELELAYLHEIGRTSQPAQAVLSELRTSIGLNVSEAPLRAVVTAAIGLVWTRDPFDRLIAAQAVAEGRPLLTKDERIRKHLELAVWD